MVTKANLAIYQGDDYVAVVTVSNGNGSPPDLTGYLAQAQIRLGAADQNPQVAAEIETAVTPPNTIGLSIPRDITVTLAGPYLWDLQLVAPDGTIQTIMAGAVTVTPEITREP